MICEILQRAIRMGKLRRKVSKFVRTGIEAINLRRDTFRCGGKGGQKQNKTESGVRLTDLNTGISCEGREHRDQLQNHNAAAERLLDLVIAYWEDKERELRTKVDTARDKRVRTYNEKRNVVKCDLSGATDKMSDVLDGKLNKLIKARLGVTEDD